MCQGRNLILCNNFWRIIVLCLLNSNCLINVSVGNASPTNNLQDTRRQAQERQERLEQPRVQMDGEETQKSVEEQDSGVRFPIQRISNREVSMAGAQVKGI